jgi:ribosomal protein L11 methyltransferase
VKRFAPYDLIMANIFARPLASMAPQLRQHLKPGGLAILAGLLASQANAVIAAHRLQGLYLVRKYRLGEWVILAFKRSGKA